MPGWFFRAERQAFSAIWSKSPCDPIKKWLQPSLIHCSMAFCNRSFTFSIKHTCLCHSPECFAALILIKIRCRPQTRAANIEYRPFERQPRSQQMKYHEKTQCEHTVCKHGRYIYRCLGMRISVDYDTSKTEICLL